MASSRAHLPLLAFSVVAFITLLSTAGVEAGVDCLESPQTFCDFVFTGELGGVSNYKGVPNFVLKAKGDNKYGTPIIHKSGIKVISLNNVGDCQFVPYSQPRDKLSCKNNFYFDRNFVATRTFQKQEPVDWFRDLAIRLYISTAQLTFANDTTINLWPRDNNQFFPEQRRCVLFTTNGETPQPLFSMYG
eukprot:TRINITY_DN20951_c0_g1_i1.p2 TRINITY_DN20951_c0_g1~~TRINITY_DN20951_c0_g1_i1.p2  ORF type:complete len:222 (-),score=30.16 TRINITY_DN20951_c0_g1_i1:667-1233(-)